MQEYERQKGKQKEVRKVITRNFLMDIADAIQIETV
jgi:hypothetical protein